jgi:hypothetical protein
VAAVRLYFNYFIIFSRLLIVDILLLKIRREKTYIVVLSNKIICLNLGYTIYIKFLILLCEEKIDQGKAFD